MVFKESLNQPYELIDWDEDIYEDEISTWAALPDGTYLEIKFDREENLENNWQVEFKRGDSVAKTGQGDAQRIFATVLLAINEFIKKQKPDRLSFSAIKHGDEKGSRQSLYVAMAKKYAASMGYVLSVKDDIYQQHYIFNKINSGLTESDNDDSKKLKGFHQSLGNAVRGRVSQMQANMAILKAQNPDTWQWEPGDIVYSAKTGRTYEIVGTWLDSRGTAKYLYRGNDDEQGTFVADRAHQTLKKISGKQGVAEAQTAKAGIVQTEVYGTRAYHAKCMEPGCDWESRRYDKIKQAQAAAKKHSEQHFNKKNVAEGKITLSTDPNWYGAEIGDYKATGPIVNISTDELVGFEPDDKMNQSKSKANVEKILAGIKRGDKLPPLLVRKYKNGYQVLDGHHRFWAYKLGGIKSIPAQIVPEKDIEEKGSKK